MASDDPESGGISASGDGERDMPTIDAASLDGEGAPVLEGGSVFGGYRIERLLGAGAMGEVYLARQVRLERPCAVKVLPRELSRSRDFSRRFEAEGRVLAKLDHPGIVRVQNAGEDGGRHFLEMEYVEEGNLDECLLKNGGRLEESRVRALLAEILEALVYAHEKGVVHRDLKPSNILVTREGRCKISDFGLVLVAGEEFVQSVVQRSLVLSQLAGQGMAFAPPGSGMNSQAPDSGNPAKVRAGSADPASVVGTPYYMSPEVQAGTGADARSDIFAVGVMAYRMLTGRLPRGLAKPPSKLVKGLDPAWDGWAAKCMEEEPGERFQSAKEALEALPGRIRQPSAEEIAARYKAEIEALRAENERLERERKAAEKRAEAARKAAEEGKRREEEKARQEAATKAAERRAANKFTKTQMTTGVLLVDSEPQGVEVIDARGQKCGVTPLRFESISSGDYKLTLKKEGYEDAAVRGEMKAGESLRLQATLKPLPRSDIPCLGRNWTVPEYDIELIWIAPGTFNMGSPVTEPGHQNDEMQHKVTLTKGFWQGKYEVTQGQWQTAMGSNPSFFKKGRVLESHWFSTDVIDNEPHESYPVENVSWDDTREFCRKLTARELALGRLPAGYEYSLPTEAQWEYACRAGTSGTYGGTGRLDSMGWHDDNSAGSTHPVGQMQANAWGLYDMHGNVWEWCNDWYGADPSGAVTDPAGPDVAARRVYRGGGWRNSASFCRSAIRGLRVPGDRCFDLGFRLALRPVR
jgi:serine/threonine protein kinase/formylglycine-generating enzyme required for sulfatase activity